MRHTQEWRAFLQEVEDKRGALRFERDEECLYRGHADTSWPLLPTLLRHCQRANIKHRSKIRDLESALFFEFRPRASELHAGPVTDWDVLFFMRHHGVATRLLDWTEVLGVAIYFALATAAPEPRPCIWLLNPYALNQVSWEIADFVAPEYLPQGDYSYAEYLTDYGEDAGFDWDKPVAIYPEQKSKRLRAQRGYFTIHGEKIAPLDKLVPSAVQKVELPPAAVRDAREFLAAAGIDEELLFPDLDALARYLHRKYEI
jgi:hypothetical protein